VLVEHRKSGTIVPIKSDPMLNLEFPEYLDIAFGVNEAASAVAIQAKIYPPRAWMGVVFFRVMLSPWMALERGAQNEERIEQVFAEQVIEEHHEDGDH
jgi:hypothetical protein